MVATETVPPYIVSSDITGLIAHWAVNNGYDAPSTAFFNDITLDLAGALRASTGAEVEIVQQGELEAGMSALVSSNASPVVSLDRAYLQNGHEKIIGHIDMTRAVDQNLEDLGTRPRPGALPIPQQIIELAGRPNVPITLIDDVVFSGNGILKLIEDLGEAGRPVERVIAGIAIQSGIDKLQNAGIEVICVRQYDEVTDEVCERDFFAGIPMSGRTVLGPNGTHWSAPYFKPFGDPENWATIRQDKISAFSRFCIERSIAIWREIELVSGQAIPAGGVPRQLHNMHSLSESFSTALGRHIESDELAS